MKEVQIIDWRSPEMRTNGLNSKKDSIRKLSQWNQNTFRIISNMWKYINYFFTSVVISAQVPDSDEQFVPDFHSENCEYLLILFIFCSSIFISKCFAFMSLSDIYKMGKRSHKKETVLLAFLLVCMVHLYTLAVLFFVYWPKFVK